MSTNTPHDPNHNDLPPGSGADARESGADALDDLLNEITQGPRHTTARHGKRHHQPKGRSQPRDEQDTLSAFARAFHQRVERSEAADSGGAALDPTLWEQIMARTSPAQPAAATAAGHSGISGSIPSSRSRSAASPPRIRPPRLYGQMLANATLALIVVLTAFGAWTVYDRVLAPPPVTPESTVPGVAMQPATPEATESDTQIDAPPVITTPEPAFACDFTRDMPIFQQVDESPIDGTALLVTTTGELVLSCPEEPEPIVLATNVGQASPAQWPGIVYTASPYDEGEMPDVVYVNAFIGETVEVGVYMSESSTGTNPEGSPWHLAPAVDDTSAWAITDLRTMENRLLSSFTEAPESFPPGTAMITSASGDTVVVGIRTENGIGGEGYLFDAEGLPGTLLVIAGSLDNAHWIDVPEDLASTRHMELSPDGQFLALKSNDGQASFDGTITYTIIRVSDGVEVARSEGIEDFSSEMRWVQDGVALAYTNTNSLMLLTTDGSESPLTLLESPYPLSNLYTTYDSDVILARQQQPEEVATETPELVQPLTYSVNTVTGESIEILGADASINMSPYEQVSRFMVMVDDYVRDGEPHTYRVIDPVTGEQTGEIADVVLPIGQGGYPSLGRFSIASTADGSTEVLGFSPATLWLMTMDGDSPVVRQIASPPGREDATQGMVNLFLSPDGWTLSLTVDGDESRTRWLLPLDAEPDSWVEVPSTVPGSDPGYIFFVKGTGAQG